MSKMAENNQNLQNSRNTKCPALYVVRKQIDVGGLIIEVVDKVPDEASPAKVIVDDEIKNLTDQDKNETMYFDAEDYSNVASGCWSPFKPAAEPAKYNLNKTPSPKTVKTSQYPTSFGGNLQQSTQRENTIFDHRQWAQYLDPSASEAQLKHGGEQPPNDNLNTGTKPKILKVPNRKPPEPPLMRNSEDFVCSICEVFVTVGRGIQLKTCKHEFCDICLTDAIMGNNSDKILCPMMIETCEAEIQDQEIQNLLAPDVYHALIEKLNQRAVQELMGYQRAFNTVPELLELENHDYVENREEFNCSVCMMSCKPGAGLMLKNCLHEFCKTCISGTIEHSDELEVQCPFVSEDGNHCDGTIQDCELRSMIPDNVYQNHLSKSLARAEAAIRNSVHCQTPDCVGWVEVDGAQKFVCQVCNKENCIACKAVHEGRSCQDYFYEINGDARKARDNALTEDQVQQLVNTRQAQPCPSCGALVQKTAGCNHMTCRCRHEFTWRGV